jgi:hypothetical protein
MFWLPLALVECAFRLPFVRRPNLLTHSATQSPSAQELRDNILIVEVREGHLKWAHLLCPKCGDHIELPLAGSERWTIKIDLLRRPTLAPSVWEKTTCGAHFFIRTGNVLWC